MKKNHPLQIQLCDWLNGCPEYSEKTRMELALEVAKMPNPYQNYQRIADWSVNETITVPRAGTVDQILTQFGYEPIKDRILECLRDASRLEALGFTRNAISDAVHGGRGYVNRLISGERKDISMDKAFLLLENLKIPLFTEINKEKMVGRLDLKDRSGTELKLMMENTELKEENEFLKRENEILKKVIGEKELELMNLRMKS